MTLFPLDAVRHATIDRQIEPLLEDVREEIALFSFPPESGMASADVLRAFDVARPRLNVLASLLRENAEPGKGADVSTGLGFLPMLLRRFEIDVVATEREVSNCLLAKAKGVELRKYCLGGTPPPFEPDSLDFLIFAEVLEHLKLSPVAVLRELASLLRVGGRLLLTTPNVARLHHLEVLASGENFLEPFPEDLPLEADATDYVEHVREYSVREVVDAVEAVGLAVQRVVMTGWGQAGYEPLPNPYASEIIVVVATRAFV